MISFATFTKWWYALPFDAPDSLFTGFPLAYACPGWHTSMSLQIFAIEFIIDLLTYFVFGFVLVFCIDHFLLKIKTFKWVTIGLWSGSGFFIAFGILLTTNPDNIFYIKRSFDKKVFETGYKFIGQKIDQPDYYNYFLKDK
ncbi:hypothetical protein C3K47_08845 [Solitalea longa]|uniref:Uncharacterized protein n=1 Tax=Solitalea longa TaxID=2079460 RepID=A0A2S5A3Q5_9SPHI|nr:hypothetical protein [Solitalea longa]POY37154.1 hypothetical protein C3K47_08845 [Solitalea longa]